MIRDSKFFRAIARVVPRSHALASMLGTQGVRAALYHHLASNEHTLIKGLGVTTSPDLFEAHLDFLRRNYDIVALDDVLRGSLPRRPMLLTFDDPFRSIVTVALPLLRRWRLPAVHFINPGCIASGLPLPEHLLNHVVGLHGTARAAAALDLDPARCHTLGDITTMLGLDGWRRMIPRLSAAFDVDAAALARSSGLYMTPDDVRDLVAGGVEIGNHTAHHYPGRVLDAAAARTEIVDASRQIEEWTGRPVRAYAQPFGNAKDMTPVVRTAIQAAGIEVAFLVQGIANRGSTAEKQPTTKALPKASMRVFDRVGFCDEGVEELFVSLEILPRLRAARARLRGSRGAAPDAEAAAQ